MEDAFFCFWNWTHQLPGNSAGDLAGVVEWHVQRVLVTSLLVTSSVWGCKGHGGWITCVYILSRRNLLRTKTCVLGVETNVWQLPKPLFHEQNKPFCAGQWQSGSYTKGQDSYCKLLPPKGLFQTGKTNKFGETIVTYRKISKQTPSRQVEKLLKFETFLLVFANTSVANLCFCSVLFLPRNKPCPKKVVFSRTPLPGGSGTESLFHGAKTNLAPMFVSTRKKLVTHLISWVCACVCLEQSVWYTNGILIYTGLIFTVFM